MIPRVVICILFLVHDFQKLFLIGFGVAAMQGAWESTGPHPASRTTPYEQHTSSAPEQRGCSQTASEGTAKVLKKLRSFLLSAFRAAALM
jgi:hypothetical protein